MPGLWPRCCPARGCMARCHRVGTGLCVPCTCRGSRGVQCNLSCTVVHARGGLGCAMQGFAQWCMYGGVLGCPICRALCLHRRHGVCNTFCTVVLAQGIWGVQCNPLHNGVCTGGSGVCTGRISQRRPGVEAQISGSTAFITPPRALGLSPKKNRAKQATAGAPSSFIVGVTRGAQPGGQPICRPPSTWRCRW